MALLAVFFLLRQIRRRRNAGRKKITAREWIAKNKQEVAYPYLLRDLLHLMAQTLLRDLVIRRIVTTTIYHVTPMLWYHVKHQLLLNKVQSFLWRIKLPWKQESLAETPHILALVAYFSKTNSVSPIFYCTKVINRPRWNSLQSLKKFCGADSELP